MGINWEILKFKYEMLGISLESLSVDNDLSLPVLRHNAKVGNWKKLSLVKENDDVIAEAQNVTKLFNAVKQQNLSSKYIELEMILLYKSIELANNLDSGDITSVAILKNLTEVLSNLLSNNPSLRPAQSEGEESSKTPQSWEINIVQGDQTKQTLQVKGEEICH